MAEGVQESPLVEVDCKALCTVIWQTQGQRQSTGTGF